jgi:osmotically-inducible protein OsmY
MSGRCCTIAGILAALAIAAAAPVAVLGQTDNGSLQRSANQVSPQAANNAIAPESLLVSAMRTNPVTAPYPISVMRQKGVLVLKGVVGTKQIHDAAVRMAIDLGAPFRDDLVIDTAAADQVALMSNVNAATTGALAQGSLSSSPYVFPPPLFGRVDDPFFGMVPPILSFPPWWRRNEPSALVPPTPAANGNPTRALPQTQGDGAGLAGVGGGLQQAGPAPPIGQVEIQVDALGQISLRGVVASEEARRAIEETARSVPGVTRVESQFQVQPRRAGGDESPPPPPQPMLGPAETEPAERRPAHPAAKPPKLNPAGTAPSAADSSPLCRRVVAALERRPTAATLPIKVHAQDGVIKLTGSVPSAFEAMVAYRAAQQTPGVKEIVDQLEFPVPDEDHPNPLAQHGRPEDVEPYLASQIRRHFGDIAQLDRIHARGNLLELRGTLQHADDKERVLAILRSMPLLNGFKIEPVFTSD